MQQYKSRVFFKCPACRADNSIEVEVPDFNFAVENMSDVTAEGPAELACEYCENEFSANVWCNASYCRFTLDHYPDIVITGDAPYFSPFEDDFWIDYDPPADAYGICLATLDGMQSLLTDEPTHKDDPQLLNRMVLSQSVSALETYLFDTLVRRVFDDRVLISRLLERDKYINLEKFTLRQLAANEKLLDEEVRKYLASILYHNLERVNFLYRAVFGISIKETEPNWVQLLEAIEKRHDCVHRNGLNAEGKRLLIFTRDFVRRVVDLIEGFVRRTQSQLPTADTFEDLQV